MEIIRRYSVIITVIICGYLLFLFTEEVALAEKKAYFSKSGRYKIRDINEVNFRDPEVMKDTHFLEEYFQCLAGVRDNKNECNNLYPPDKAEQCKDFFDEYQAFFGRLLTEGKTNHQILLACRRMIKGNNEPLSLEDCELAAVALLRNTSTFCEKHKSNPKLFRECKAMGTGNSSLCSDQGCRDKTIYIKAIRNKDVKICGRIRNSSISLMCRGFLSLDEEECKKNAGFIKFCKRHHCK